MPGRSGLFVVLLLRAAVAYTSESSVRRISFALSYSSSDSFSGNGVHHRRPLMAAGQERRDEERRWQELKDEVVAGKNSDVYGAQKYLLEPKVNDEAWLKQASQIENLVYRYTELGLEKLKMILVDEADEAFDEVYRIKPDAYVWQAGVIKFYKKNYMDASKLFAENAARCESKFMEVASEERLWRDACELNIRNSLSRKERDRFEKEEINLVPQCQEISGDLPREMRRSIRVARNMFNASLRKDTVNELFSRAQLWSMCSRSDTKDPPNRKLRKICAWYYLGLYYDATDEVEKGKACMKMAIKLSPGSQHSVDIIHSLPLLHMVRRDWLDDVKFEDDPLMVFDRDTDGDELPFPGINTLAMTSIYDGINNLRRDQLRMLMKQIDGKKSGEKAELQKQLFKHLMMMLKSDLAP